MVGSAGSVRSDQAQKKIITGFLLDYILKKFLKILRFVALLGLRKSLCEELLLIDSVALFGDWDLGLWKLNFQYIIPWSRIQTHHFRAVLPVQLTSESTNTSIDETLTRIVN